MAKKKKKSNSSKKGKKQKSKQPPLHQAKGSFRNILTKTFVAFSSLRRKIAWARVAAIEKRSSFRKVVTMGCSIPLLVFLE